MRLSDVLEVDIAAEWVSYGGQVCIVKSSCRLTRSGQSWRGCDRGIHYEGNVSPCPHLFIAEKAHLVNKYCADGLRDRVKRLAWVEKG